MEYIKLAELVYKVVKHPSQWNNQDVKRIGKMEKILKREIESELASVGLVAVDATEDDKTTVTEVNDNVTTTEPVVEVNTQDIQPVSFMERVFAEQDQKLDETIKMEPKKPLADRYSADALQKPKENVPASNSRDGVKRYSMNIVCGGVIGKPPFQIFKCDDIVEKDFKTDQITNTQYVFYTVIDGVHKDITEALTKYFANAYITGMTQQADDYVPPQYAAYFRNQTKLE
jgi:hypothetical protein